MKSKNTVIAVIVTALVTCLATSTVKDVIDANANNGLGKKLKTVTDIVENYSIYDTDEKKMADNASKAIVYTLDDPYTNYYSKDEYDSLMGELHTSYMGIGITISVDTDVNKLIVVSTVEGQAAEKSGVLPGDYIIAADGKTYTGSEMNEAVAAMRGTELENPEGTSVVITIERNGEKMDITVPRGVVKRESVSSKLLGDGIGYIRINQFQSKDSSVADSKDTYDEFSEHITDLQNNNITSLIIDLRNNPGGDLDVVTKIADYLLPEGVITYTEDKNGKKEYFNSDAKSVDLPMAVLVNGGSASASEVLSGALKDHSKATLVGEKTFGKGVVQTVFPLYDGSGLTVTSARYYTPSGNCIHEKGIEPDVAISMDSKKSISQLQPEEDVQLQKAIEVLKSK